MPTLTTTGIVVPSTFPSTSYDNLHTHIVAGHAGTPAYKKYSGGWSALSYRYAEALECVDEFEQFFLASGAAPSPPDRYKQERVLFDFYGSAVSSLEAFAFAVFAMASLRKSSDFPLATPSDERKVTPAYLSKKLIAHFPGDPLTIAWENLLQDSRYYELHGTRNVLTHRTIVSRHHFLGGSNGGTAIWELTGVTITKDMLKPSADDLTSLLAQVVPLAEQFAVAHC